MKIGHGEFWSAALDQPGPWSYLLLGTTFGSEEEARGACHDCAEVSAEHLGVPTKTWPFVRRAA